MPQSSAKKPPHPAEPRWTLATPAIRLTWRHQAVPGRGYTALKDVNLEVGAGRGAALVGPSGCGKSTTLSLIAGLDSPTEGKVFGREREVEGVGDGSGFLFQRDALLP